MSGDLLEFRESKRSDEVRGIVLGDAVELRGQVARPLYQAGFRCERAFPLPRRLGRPLASHVSRLHLISLLPHLAQANCAVKPERSRSR